MKNLTIDLTKNAEAELDKLKLFLMLCEAKLEKDIDLPIERTTILGYDLLDEKLGYQLKRLFLLSRKIGISMLAKDRHSVELENFSSRLLISLDEFHKQKGNDNGKIT